MFLGGQPAAAPFVLCSKFFTVTYFAYLLLTIPFINFLERYVLRVILKKAPTLRTPESFKDIGHFSAHVKAKIAKRVALKRSLALKLKKGKLRTLRRKYLP